MNKFKKTVLYCLALACIYGMRVERRGRPSHQPDGPPAALRCPQCGDHVVAIQVAV